MKNLEFIGKSVFLRKERVLVVADLHFGFEEATAESGILAPRVMYDEIIKDMKKIFEAIGKVKEIVILGDIKHEFGGVLPQERNNVSNFIKFLKEHTEKIILVKGNHDNMIELILRKSEAEIKDFYIKGENLFLHGHKILSDIGKNIKRIFLGHRHPAITISKEAKRETYKCFLAGKWKNKEIIILPSIFPLIEGSDVFVDDTNLEIKIDLKNFEVFAVGDKVYHLGKARDVGAIN